ncbi:hypothetical protein [Bradyrhizobium sp. AZCC 1721]|uniref:hypothetical protein n=1 Tax=Bradyrhizobium sp. AZCC 1721 TaxID=3117016 RepID=UPI002FF305F0
MRDELARRRKPSKRLIAIYTDDAEGVPPHRANASVVHDLRDGLGAALGHRLMLTFGTYGEVLGDRGGYDTLAFAGLGERVAGLVKLTPVGTPRAPASRTASDKGGYGFTRSF